MAEFEAWLRRAVTAAATVALCALPSMGWAQSFTLYRPAPSTSASGVVQGGSQADPADWPATYIFDGPSGLCTATVVGSRVLVTAAHCIVDAAPGKFRKGGVPVTCWQHDSWTSGPRNDVALCLSRDRIKLDASRPYESVGGPADAPAAKQDLVLLGYGCTAVGGSQGVLYEGTSPVESPPNANDPFFSTDGPVAVCSGDSGGGAYALGAGSARRLIGVASIMIGRNASDFAALSDADVRRWVDDWTKARRQDGNGKNEVTICGIDPGLSGCHQ